MCANIVRRGLMLVLSSPSGAGKTTLSRGLLASDDAVTMSVSMTTRPPRPGEVDGEDYIFVDPQQFGEMRNRGGCSNSPRFSTIITARPKHRSRRRYLQGVMCCSTLTGRERNNCRKPRLMIWFACSFCHQRLPNWSDA
ncbi:MAG: hypothetical protein CM15mP21_4120 [Hyphomicrobiales bacterium]|nr:MAG: hypothetical protein CM15mP21_4120 [Hyphomicrobiales bacterium]